MGNIKINIPNVLSASEGLKQPYNNIKRVRSSITSIRSNVYRKLSERNNIDNQFSTAIMQLRNVEQRIEKLQRVSYNAANKYRETDLKLFRLLRENSTTLYGVGVSSGKNISKFHAEPDKAKKKTAKPSQQAVKPYIGNSKGIVSEISKIWKKTKNSYENKGTVYKIAQYGKVVAGAGKIITGVGAIASGAGIAVGVLVITSGINDMVNSVNNVKYLSKKQYDELDKHNMLKDFLIERGSEFGEEVFHDQKAGKKIGQTLYTGVNVVNLLYSADKMLDAYGKVNTAYTGVQKSSFVWGDADDVALNAEKIKFNLSIDYVLKRIIDINPNGKFNVTYDAAKGTYKTVKKAISIGNDVAQLATE